MSTTPSTVRLTVDLSTETNTRLNQIAAKLGTTKSDVLRKAIALVELAASAKERGLKLGLARKDQEIATEIVGL